MLNPNYAPPLLTGCPQRRFVESFFGLTALEMHILFHLGTLAGRPCQASFDSNLVLGRQKYERILSDMLDQELRFSLNEAFNHLMSRARFQVWRPNNAGGSIELHRWLHSVCVDGNRQRAEVALSGTAQHFLIPWVKWITANLGFEKDSQGASAMIPMPADALGLYLCAAVANRKSDRNSATFTLNSAHLQCALRVPEGIYETYSELDSLALAPAVEIINDRAHHGGASWFKVSYQPTFTRMRKLPTVQFTVSGFKAILKSPEIEAPPLLNLDA